MKTEKIILCPACQGKGTKTSRELRNWHKKEYDEKVEYCPKCNGSGRLVETTEVTTRPYNINEEV